MKILSIDWDYFYPDSAPYDWGANEEKGIFYEIIWSIRASNRNLVTQAFALDEYVPTIPRNFWKRVVSNNPAVMMVADSHFALFDLLRNADLTHLDAHHDCGYCDIGKDFQSDQAHVDCGNWGRWGKFMGKIETNRLYYPEWRKEYDETKPPTWILDEMNYGLPEPEDYDMIFVCRSSCWTPPWFDKKFRSFVQRAPAMKKQFMDDMCQKIRKPDLKQARILREQQLKLWDGINKEGGVTYGTVSSSQLQSA